MIKQLKKRNSNEQIETVSEDRKKYLHKVKLTKMKVFTTQILLIVAFIALWEILARTGKIDSFITSQPSRIWNTFINLTTMTKKERIVIIKILV